MAFSLARSRKGQNVLVSLAIDAERHDHVVSTEHDPVDVNDQDVLVLKAAFRQLLEGLFRSLDGLSADRGLAEPDRFSHLR